MKTVEQIINQDHVYLQDWEGGTREGILLDFIDTYDDVEDADFSEFEGVEILFAYYSYESYSGTAFVIFSKYDKLYEVNGSHCSCYGLENQWTFGDELVLKELKNRLENGYFGEPYDSVGFKTELKLFIGL